MRKAIFLDRDGLINRCAAEHSYIKKWEDFHFLPGVAESITCLNHAGYLVLVVTNQRGIARGLMTQEDVNKIHEKMCSMLELQGAHIDGIYVCPHDIGQCNCRKPNIGLFLQAEKDYKIDKSSSWMIGDSDTDVEAGRNYGIKAIKTDCLTEAVIQIIG